jgi:hypothetical protein
LEFEKDFPPLEEIFIGSNSIQYRHVYYLAQMSENTIDGGAGDPREIKSVCWLSYDQVVQKIQPENVERLGIFKYVDGILRGVSPIPSKSDKNIVFGKQKDVLCDVSNALRFTDLPILEK